jgi:hypothetical protein
MSCVSRCDGRLRACLQLMRFCRRPRLLGGVRQQDQQADGGQRALPWNIGLRDCEDCDNCYGLAHNSVCYLNRPDYEWYWMVMLTRTHAYARKNVHVYVLEYGLEYHPCGAGREDHCDNRT